VGLRKEWVEKTGLGFKLPGLKLVEIAVISSKKESAA
jgi:hypothetical protein